MGSEAVRDRFVALDVSDSHQWPGVRPSADVSLAMQAGPALPRWRHTSSGSTSSMATREVLYDHLQEMGVSDERGSAPECESGVADP